MSYQLKLWDSKREKINRPKHTAGHSQNKGTEQVQRSQLAADQPSPTGGRRQGVGERGRLGPKDRITYHTANRPPVSNQRPPEILHGRHPLGGSRRDTGRRHPTCTGGDWGWGHGEQKAHTPDWRGETETGTAEGRRRAPPGESAAPQAPGCLSRVGGEGTKRRCSRVSAFVEDPRARTAHSAGHAPYRAAGSLSSIDGESSTPPSPQRKGTSNLNKRPPPPACVRAEIRH